jgi:hypothetical protein
MTSKEIADSKFTLVFSAPSANSFFAKSRATYFVFLTVAECLRNDPSVPYPASIFFIGTKTQPPSITFVLIHHEHGIWQVHEQITLLWVTVLARLMGSNQQSAQPKHHTA